MKRGVVILALCAAVLWGVILFVPAPGDRDATPTAPARVLSVSPGGLADAYQRNEVAADQRYRDQPVMVSGVVAEIGRGLAGGAYLILTGQGGVVRCEFPGKNEQQVAALAKGQSVTVKGTGAGLSMGVPRLKECRLH